MYTDIKLKITHTQQVWRHKNQGHSAHWLLLILGFLSHEQLYEEDWYNAVSRATFIVYIQQSFT